MRVSNHKGRTNKKGQTYNVSHNDRNYTSDIDKHINKEKTKDNIYIIIDECGVMSDKKDISLRDHEIEMYHKYFDRALQSKNEKARKQRHPERCKTMDSYLDGKNSCPEEEILQIGKEGVYQDVDTFRRCVEEYIKRHQSRFPDIKILDASVHVDETSIHCHLRKVYTYSGKDGLEVGQHRCLENLGYTLPDPEKPRGQRNNLKIPYTRDSRDLWIEVCEEMDRDLTVDRKPDPKSYSEDLSEYKRQKSIEKYELGQKILENQRQTITENQRSMESFRQTLKEAKAFLQDQGVEVDPERSIIDQLIAFLKSIREEIQKLLVQKPMLEEQIKSLSISVQQMSTLDRQTYEARIKSLQQKNQRLQSEVEKLQTKSKSIGRGSL